MPDIASKLSAFLGSEALFARQHGLYSADDREVDEDEWRSADDEDRFFRFSKLVGASRSFSSATTPSRISNFARPSRRTMTYGRYFEEVTGIPLA